MRSTRAEKKSVKDIALNTLGVILLGLMCFVIIGMVFGVFREGAILL